MSITLICPHLHCGKAVVAPDSARGKTVRCVHCGNQFQVPFRVTPTPDESAADQSEKSGATSKRKR